MEKLKSYLSGRRWLAIALAILILGVISSILSPSFLKLDNFRGILMSTSITGIMAIGMTFVILTGGIDISVGSVTALVCMAAANQMENHGMNAYTAIALALVIGLLYGIVQGYLISYLEIQPFIVSLAGLFFGRGLTSMISTEMISIKNETFLAWANYKIYLPIGSYSRRGVFHPAYIYPTVVVALIIVVIIAIVMKFTKFGRDVYAVGGNAQSAMMMGLNVRKTKFKAYILNGVLAGCGGFLFCLNSCSGFVEQAKGLEMDAISASVIGGTLLSGGVGTPFGTIFGVLIKGTISSLITTQGTLSSWWVRIVLSALLCFFIVLQAVFAHFKKK